MLSEDGQSRLLCIRVSPKSSKNTIVGFKNEQLLIAVRAAPQDGQTNRAVIEVLSAILGHAKSNFEIIQGQKSRQKTVQITGMSVAQITEKLGAG